MEKQSGFSLVFPKVEEAFSARTHYKLAYKLDTSINLKQYDSEQQPCQGGDILCDQVFHFPKSTSWSQLT